MATINDLKLLNIGEMEEPDAIALILQVRSRRRERVVTRKKSQPKKSKNSPESLLASMDEAQIAELLRKLTELMYD